MLLLSVEQCPRCGSRHDGLKFTVIGTDEAWTKCPTTKGPVVAKLRAVPTEKWAPAEAPGGANQQGAPDA